MTGSKAQSDSLLAIILRILHLTSREKPQDKQLEFSLKEALTMLELSIDHLQELSTQRVENRAKTENMVRHNIQWMNSALKSIGRIIDTPQDLTDSVRGLSADTSDLLDSVNRALPGIKDGFNQLNKRITENLSEFMGTHQVPGRSDLMLLEN